MARFYESVPNNNKQQQQRKTVCDRAIGLWAMVKIGWIIGISRSQNAHSTQSGSIETVKRASNDRTIWIILHFDWQSLALLTEMATKDQEPPQKLRKKKEEEEKTNSPSTANHRNHKRRHSAL